MTPSWFITFVTRMVFFEMNFILFMLHRTGMGDNVNFLTGFLGTQIGAVLFETSLYLNTKQKLQLFVRMKKSEQQEKQLAELLDAVPDCVLICSKDQEAEAKPSQSIYANFKMNDFYGQDVVNY